MKHVFLICVGLLAVAGLGFGAEDPVFSGPQAGERLTALGVRGIFDEQAGKDADFVKQAAGKPTLLVFVHEFNRPSLATTRVLMDYAATRKKDGLFSGIVMLNDDYTAEAERLKRARHALPKGTPIGVSVDGREGPGAYGLNRNVTLTVLVANENQVTANFALVQPSVQADVPRVLEALVKQIGGKVPKLEELNIPGYRRMVGPGTPRPSAGENAKPADEALMGLLRQLIRKDADEAAVERAAKAIEKSMADKPAARRDVGERARRIVEGGKLANYGTKKAQEYLQKWAKEFAASEAKQSGEKPIE